MGYPLSAESRNLDSNRSAFADRKSISGAAHRQIRWPRKTSNQLNHIDKAVPATLDVHLIVDNYATHKHPKVKAWLAKRPRYHIHFTPTYSSWLNQVERWFGLITQQSIRRGSFESVRQLVVQIQLYVEHYNVHKCPFVWTATADSILAKVQRLCKVICGTQH
ncbi:hypothetical protein P3T21_005512 [Paraburkholderia sp. GAS334]